LHIISFIFYNQISQPYIYIIISSIMCLFVLQYFQIEKNYIDSINAYFDEVHILWYILVFCGILGYILVFCNILWCIQVFCDILWYTLVYSGILCYTLVYSDILWYTLVYSGILWYTCMMIINDDKLCSGTQCGISLRHSSSIRLYNSEYIKQVNKKSKKR